MSIKEYPIAGKSKDESFYYLHNSEVPYPKDKTIYQIFQDQVEKTPYNVAITFEGRAITYLELNERSNQLARYIRKEYLVTQGRKLEPDTLIAIFLDKSVDMLITMLGIMKAGAVYVPININDPDKRISYLLNDTQCELVITHSKLTTKLIKAVHSELDVHEEGSPHLIPLDTNAYRHENIQNLPRHNKPTDLAYIIYTSGTTGKPKGVMIEHHSVINLACSRKNDFSIDESSVVLQFSPITFDASVCEIFSALLHGARLVMVTDEVKRDPTLLTNSLHTERVSVATILPSLLAQISLADCPELPYLKTLIVAGEPCTKDVMQMWSKGRQLINAYGPSESTVCATLHHFKSGDLPSTIGGPIQNTAVYILDKNLSPTPKGVTGELYISGVGLARGYFNKVKLTDERFISNPFSAPGTGHSHSRLYKTGDLVRHLENGNIEYIGRNDFQVKIRGHRIELGELENTLLSYPAIKQVCVLAKNRINTPSESTTDTSASKYLVVYYVANQEIDTDKCINFLSQCLPEYMVPNHFIWQDAFPLTNNGKVDRNRLPEPRTIQEKQDRITPYTKLESTLLDIWQSVLGFEQISIKDDFFKIGGNSLLVITLAVKINTEFNFKINVSLLLVYRTISDQAAFLLETNNSNLEFKPIATFQSHGLKPPLFFIHPSMSGSELYKSMVNVFDQDQPFYGVESYNFNHLEDPETDLRSLAKRYVDYIRVVQPHGPYYLGGYSLGGNISYEIAHQLINLGETVEGVYLVDSVLPAPFAKKDGVTYKDAKNFLEYFEFKDTENQRLLELAKIEMELLFSYYPTSKLPVKLVLIKATNLFSPLDNLEKDHIANHFFQVDKAYSGWDQFAREVNQYKIDADHETIVEPQHLARVASIIQKEINLPESIEMFSLWS
ncbi:non-ribosomal peptide synthetase [Moritella yayanosii]|uniref:Putative Phenylalanine racemase (ATP-hydrolyzing) n=1 Tax=Moritella yayanosii TaxID=69539 RepID=A0A330LMV4_9GAMM|nr:amino acid adenylation domain-containing protein [Moritella yayanosii]SQD78013.1 putative Phenylalanine racemase (ATP-hydrolyzing) [Moritella yayanosii]